MMYATQLNYTDVEYIYVNLPKKKNVHWIKVRQACSDWCMEHDGFGTYVVGAHGVYFSDERDASIFVLRWGS